MTTFMMAAFIENPQAVNPEGRVPDLCVAVRFLEIEKGLFAEDVMQRGGRSLRGWCRKEFGNQEYTIDFYEVPSNNKRWSFPRFLYGGRGR